MIFKYFKQSPISLFLVDGLGALLTAFLLFVIMSAFNEYFGMPQRILLYLATTAAVFCLYSTTCFFLLKDHWQPFLKVIIGANLLYCCLTMGLVIYYYPGLTALGVSYFVAEIFVIIGLVFVELKTLEA